MRVAQPIAAWLVARPLHAVLGLALTLLLPFAQVFSGATMTMIVLRQGWRLSMLQGALAAGLVAVMAAVTGAPVVTILVNALVFWLPASLAAVLVRRSRSLTLTFQVTGIIALVGTLMMYVVLPDPTAFWKQTLTEVAAAFSERGFDQQANLLVEQQDVIAPQMTVLFVLTTWSLITLVLALGYGLFQALPENRGKFGRFCDLDFGRVLALVMVLASVLALLTSAEWAQGFAFVAFTIFWIQGLSVLHWLHTEGPLPIAVLIVAYVMLPVLNAVLIMGLAVLGYADAWFDVRSRLKGRGARE